MSLSEQELSLQLKRITDHLGFLEKKLDTLIEQSRAPKPFNRFGSGPHRSHSRPGYPARPAGAGWQHGHRPSSHRPPRHDNR
ncbi:MAG: hypothetical protein HYZ52_01075 [Candidatus Omnitrophica bacterium]|nr:hypothetical protein [Candidatus Omnitrophota bacterium]